MSIGSVYETAYKGDFNQVKVKIDANNRLIETPDSVRKVLTYNYLIKQSLSVFS